MRLLKWFTKLLFGEDEDTTIDHMPIKKDAKRDWRDKELKKASEKYGKPFKCSSRKFAREVMTTPERFVAAAPNEDATEQEVSPVILLDNHRGAK